MHTTAAVQSAQLPLSRTGTARGRSALSGAGRGAARSHSPAIAD